MLCFNYLSDLRRKWFYRQCVQALPYRWRHCAKRIEWSFLRSFQTVCQNNMISREVSNQTGMTIIIITTVNGMHLHDTINYNNQITAFSRHKNIHHFKDIFLQKMLDLLLPQIKSLMPPLNESKWKYQNRFFPEKEKSNKKVREMTTRRI